MLLLAVAAGVGGWWFGAGRYVTTPGVVNLSARAADAKLSAAGLHADVAGRAFSETVPTGSVVRTDPAGGENVTRDGTVALTLSRGPERHDVPRLRGRSLDAAQAALQDAHLAYGDATYAYSEKTAKGSVLRSDPKAGTTLRRGVAVDVVVSKGPHPVKVPDLTEGSADEAKQQLKKLHLKVETTQENSDDVDKGDVISQSTRPRPAVPRRHREARGLQGPGPGDRARRAPDERGERDHPARGGRLLGAGGAHRVVHRPRPGGEAEPGLRRPGTEGQHHRRLRGVTPRREE